MAFSGAAAEPPTSPQATVLWTKGRVEFSPARSANWYAAATNQVLYAGDQVRTGDRSRATLRLLRDLSIMPMGELTTIRLQDRPQRTCLILLRGILSFFHRGQPGDIEVEGGGINATIRGTEFVFGVDDTGTATVTLYDGAVALTNQLGGALLHSGEIAVVPPGQPPRRTAALLSGDLNAIQWALYYPAILDLDELGWTAPPAEALRASVESYRTGHLPHALANYPRARNPASPEEKIFLAALLLSLGNVAEAERRLGEVNGDGRAGRLADAQRELIAAVKRQPGPGRGENLSQEGMLATEWLALSYHRQAGTNLQGALQAAVLATERSPGFGFAWARRAELEFSFGRVRETEEALQRAVILTPQNAEAIALEGFILAARNRVQEGQVEFERALALDGALGNAWLGHGLCRIRQGDLKGGRADLETAAAMEPQRAVLRSYLAKAFGDEWNLAQAEHELDLARKLDPNDPTAWLYRSLLDRDQNRINDAIRDLSRAQDSNDNRALFRSRLMLDQDRAVAAANQAIAFRDAGMFDVSVQSASRAVAADYANASAHQFLADSYASSDRIDLRYETPRVSEYLLANLLAPVGGGILSASLSQQEYSKLFERDGVGMFSDTAYLSRGAWTQDGGVHGTFGDTSFLAEAFYETDRGYVANNDLEQQSYTVQFKQQISAQDTFYIQALYSDFNSGDLARYYNPNTLDRNLRVREWLDPIFLMGWHRQWSPQSHTLFLAGVLRDTQQIRDPTQQVLALETDASGTVTSLVPFHIDQRYQSDTSIFTVELQQLWQGVRHSALAGVRYQYGQFDIQNEHGANDAYNPLVLSPSSIQVSPNMERVQAYAYEAWRVLPDVQIFAGLSFDYLSYPLDFQYAPPTAGEHSRTMLSPKAGLVWELAPQLHVRGAYTRSLGGVSFEQSFRLEPTQVAGFNQAFRSLIPESVAGVSAAPEFDTFDLALETRLGMNTWISLGAERLTSEVDRRIGVYEGDPDLELNPALAQQDLRYEDNALRVTFDQLLNRYVSVGAQYRLSWTTLEDKLADIPASLASIQHDKALLHDLRLSTHFNHPCGVFATVEAVWYGQANRGDSSLPDEDLWQINLTSGYRFAHRHAEIAVGVLNVTDRDYRLNPLSLYSLLERQRTFFARLRWAF